MAEPRDLAILGLMRQGSSREDAIRTVNMDGVNIDKLAADELAATEADVAEAQARTPEAIAERRRAEGKALRVAAEKRAEEASDARLLLASEGLDVSELTDDEVLHAARIDVRPELMSRQEKDETALHLAHSGEWSKITDTLERQKVCRDLGIEGGPAVMDSYVDSLNPPDGDGLDSPHVLSDAQALGVDAGGNGAAGGEGGE